MPAQEKEEARDLVVNPLQQKLFEEALAIEEEDARQAGAIGYYSRLLAQITLPHRDPKTPEFKRSNGLLTLTIHAPEDIGLPFGNIPRLFLAWISTEAVRTKDPCLYLGNNMASFFEELGIGRATGGKTGTITRFRSQATRLFASSILTYKNTDSNTKLRKIDMIEDADLWWDPKEPDQFALFESTVTLNQRFFRELTERPIPIDMRALRAVKNSPMKIDILTWLTYRLPNMRRGQVVPWEGLQMQFGAGYPMTPKGKYDFKRSFLQNLKDVHMVYQAAKVSQQKSGLLLQPSPPLVPFKIPRA